MDAFGVIDYIALIVYFGAMASLGPWFAKKARTTEGYFLGDRQFPGWLIGFSLFATSISSITFVAYPADAFRTAWYRMTPNFAQPVAVLIAILFFLPFFRRGMITSAYQYLEMRFGPWTRVYAAAAYLVSQVIRVSLVLYLISVILYTVTGLNPYLTIVVAGVITSFYTVLGGIRAVVWTDFIQAMVLFGGGLLCLVFIVMAVPGGMPEIISTAIEDGKLAMADLNPETNELEPVPWLPDLTQKTVTLIFLMGLGHWLFEFSSQQQIIQRYVASRSARDAKMAMWVNCLFSIPTWALFLFLGTALYVFYSYVYESEYAMALLEGAEGTVPEEILPYFVITQLPVGVTGIILAAVMAAAMSSLSSSINAFSSVMHTDIYSRHIAPGKTDRHYVIVAKIVSAGLGVVMVVGAMLLRALEETTLQDTATVITALTAGGLLGLYLLGFFTTLGDDRSMLCGIGLTLLFTLWMVLSRMGFLPDALTSPIHSYYASFLGHGLMFGVGFFFGKFVFPRKYDEHALDNLTVWTQDDTPIE